MTSVTYHDSTCCSYWGARQINRKYFTNPPPSWPAKSHFQIEWPEPFPFPEQHKGTDTPRQHFAPKSTQDHARLYFMTLTSVSWCDLEFRGHGTSMMSHKLWVKRCGIFSSHLRTVTWNASLHVPYPEIRTSGWSVVYQCVNQQNVLGSHPFPSMPEPQDFWLY